MGVHIAGYGSVVPGRSYTNHELSSLYGYGRSGEDIERVTGISRRNIDTQASTTQLGTVACERALREAGIIDPQAAGITEIRVATSTPDQVFPNTASQIAGKLGLAGNLSCSDENLACAGFVRALGMAATNLHYNESGSALVVGVDVLSRITDYPDYRTGTLFGDGGGAIYLQLNDSLHGGLVSTSSFTQPDYDILSCSAPSSGHQEGFIAMNGREVMRVVKNVVPKEVERALAKDNLTIDQVDRFYFHQANGKMLKMLATEMGVDPTKVPTEGVLYTGNTSAGTIPIIYAMDAAKGKITEGQILVFCGFGAGMCIETVVWET